jgi:hypothetical protein
VTDTVGRVGLAFPVLLAVALLVSGAVGGPRNGGRQRLDAPFLHAGRRQVQRPFQRFGQLPADITALLSCGGRRCLGGSGLGLLAALGGGVAQLAADLVPAVGLAQLAAFEPDGVCVAAVMSGLGCAGVGDPRDPPGRELRRKNRELEQTVEKLKAATHFFARECDPRHR